MEKTTAKYVVVASGAASSSAGTASTIEVLPVHRLLIQAHTSRSKSLNVSIG